MDRVRGAPVWPRATAAPRGEHGTQAVQRPIRNEIIVQAAVGEHDEDVAEGPHVIECPRVAAEPRPHLLRNGRVDLRQAVLQRRDVQGGVAAGADVAVRVEEVHGPTRDLGQDRKP